MPRLRGRSCQAAGVRRSRRPGQHAMADGSGGQDTGLAWEVLVRGKLDQPECDRIEKALRAYRGQDTLALVQLVGQLRLLS